MTHFAFAARSHVRNAVLCTLATLTLAACGSEDGSSGSAATSAAAPGSSSVATLVSPNAGVIDRSIGVATPTGATTAASGTQTAATTSGTTSSSSTASSSASPTTTTSGSGTTVVAPSKGT